MAIAQNAGMLNSGDVKLFYRRFGLPAGGLPMVILHGLSYFSWDWIGIGSELAAEREVVCLDVRGFGESTWSPSKDYTVPTLGQDLLNLLDHLGWAKAILVGHSMSGRSTTFVAAKHPQRAAGLALVDYSPENAPGGGKRVSEMVAHQPDAFATIEQGMAYYGSKDRKRYEAYLKPVPGGFAVKRDTYFRDQFRRTLETGERPKLGVDMWQLVGEVRCPILSMRGARSDMYAAETAEKMKAANPRLRVVEVDAGHNIGGENPAGFLAALRPFAASLEEKADAYTRH